MTDHKLFDYELCSGEEEGQTAYCFKLGDLKRMKQADLKYFDLFQHAPCPLYVSYRVNVYLYQCQV